MMGRNHIIIGAAAGIALSPDYPSLVFTVPFAVVGSLFPDIDTTTSNMGRTLYPISFVISKLTRHRGFTHSFAMAALLYIGLSYSFSWLSDHYNITIPLSAALAFVGGHVSHILVDTFNKRGVQLLWPLNWFMKLSLFKSGVFFEYSLALSIFALLTINWYYHGPLFQAPIIN